MKTLFVVLVLLMIVASACAPTSATMENRNAKLGIRSADSNFLEAQQIATVEDWKDTPGKIVNVYLINPVTGGLLVDPIQCFGVPNSSTESLEPNMGYSSSAGTYLWEVPVDGANIYTSEMPGKDGTFGDPVHFRYCISVDGNYFDFPAYGLPYLTSSASFTFPEATVKRDFEAEARLLIAEEVLKRGGCINPETLVEIPCEK